MPNNLTNNIYTDIDPEDFWVEILHSSIFRASDSPNKAKYVNTKGLRPNDFNMVAPPDEVRDRMKDKDRWIMPNFHKGLSFADSVQTLHDKKIGNRYIFRGKPAWEITPGSLPKNIVINYQDKSHPMISVAVPMLESEFISKMQELVDSGRYRYTGGKV